MSWVQDCLPSDWSSVYLENTKTKPERRVPGTLNRVLYTEVPWDLEDNEGYRDGTGVAPGRPGRRTTNHLDEAEVVSSELKGSKKHAPVFDLDIPHTLVPSSTEGHSHLYLDVPMPWWKYRVLLRVLAWTGIVQKGYVGASIARGHTDVRLPWVKKRGYDVIRRN